MSGFWRTAVDYHASTLNPFLSHVLSLLADGADEMGHLRVDYPSLAWRARAKEPIVRKAVASLLEAGAVWKVKGAFALSRDLLACPTFCPCPRGTAPDNAYDKAVGALPGTAISVPNYSGTIHESSASMEQQAIKALETDVTTSTCEMAWRDRFKTEPTPGLIRKTVQKIASTDGAQLSSLPKAFREYLARISDPMYLSLPKFAETWRSYLEPARKKADGIAEFDKAFADVAFAFMAPGPAPRDLILGVGGQIDDGSVLMPGGEDL